MRTVWLVQLIDEWIGKLTNLVHLNLRENNFNGPIPPSIGNLTQLTKLLLGEKNSQVPACETLASIMFMVTYLAIEL